MSLKEVFLKEKKLYLVYELLDRDLYKLIETTRDKKELIPEDLIRLLLH